MKTRHSLILCGLLIAATILIIATGQPHVLRTSGPLEQAVLLPHGADLDYAAIMSQEHPAIIESAHAHWIDSNREADVRISRKTLPPVPTFISLNMHISLLFSIDHYEKTFEVDDPHVQQLATELKATITNAHSAGWPVSELIIDFPAQSWRLGDYRQWLISLKKAAGETPLHIIAQPEWMNVEAFMHLLKETDGFILSVRKYDTQVYAGEKLHSNQTLEEWIEAAARHEKSFRILLPSPADATQKSIAAQWISNWTERRPEPFTGIIWQMSPPPPESSPEAPPEAPPELSPTPAS